MQSIPIRVPRDLSEPGAPRCRNRNQTAEERGEHDAHDSLRVDARRSGAIIAQGNHDDGKNNHSITVADVQRLGDDEKDHRVRVGRNN